MLFHVTYTDREGNRQTGRVSGEGSTAAIQRRDAIRTLKGRVYGARNVSAVACPRPRAVTPHPAVLTPGQG